MPAKKELELIPEGELQICQFSGKEIRKVLHNDEWFFSIVDIIAAMTDSNRPRNYWSDLKTKLSATEGFTQLSDKIAQLKMPAKDGKLYETDCGNTETFTLISVSGLFAVIYDFNLTIKIENVVGLTDTVKVVTILHFIGNHGLFSLLCVVGTEPATSDSADGAS